MPFGEEASRSLADFLKADTRVAFSWKKERCGT